jgi:integrase
VHSRKRTQIIANTVDSYSTAVAYLNEQIGDMPLASIDNPEAKASITTMKTAVKDGRRRFSDSTVSYYFRIMRQVIASQLDERFRPVHRREWNLAAIGLPRVNPKNQRRPTMTPKEMTTLLGKAEGQYLMIYFLSLVTGMRISEALAIEIDKHIESDCSIIYVRQQREKDLNALKSNPKLRLDCVTSTFILKLRKSCVTSSGAERVAFYSRLLTERCLIPAISTGTA